VNAWWLLVAGVGVVILVASVAAARKDSIGPWAVPSAINGLPDWLYDPLAADAAGQPAVGTLAGSGRGHRR
jgi:hypothetical protein